LLDLFDQGTVFVVGRTASGDAAFGSGFFVTPDRIVTNAHVVKDMHPERMFVTNKKFGKVLRATAVAVTPTVAPDADYAILRVEDAPTVQPLALATSAERIQPVIAAGYPALVVTTDARFDSLLQGNVTEIPELVTTPGSISTLQAAVPNRPLIAHTAQVAQGNSGGPLFDNCGRVVGVNTFGRINAGQAQSANYAQKIDSLIEFLSANGVQATTLTDSCQLIGNLNTVPAPPAPAQGQPAPAQALPPSNRPLAPLAPTPPAR
jgi:S1-C subfamily serine protease